MDTILAEFIDEMVPLKELISLKIFLKREFERLCGLQTPFMMHVLEEGIKIG